MRLTEAEKVAQAKFKAKFDMPYSDSTHLSSVDREIVRLNLFFDEFKDCAFFRQQYKKAWTDAGYSEYVFEYYLLKTAEGCTTIFCKEDSGIAESGIEKLAKLIYEVIDILLKKNGPAATDLVTTAYQCTPQQAHSFIRALVKIESITLSRI